MAAKRRARARPQTRARSPLGRAVAAAAVAVLALAAASVLSVAAYGIVRPPATPLMWQRGLVDGVWPEGRQWVPLGRISRHLERAVIASEDQRFCTHAGFDWIELRRVWRQWRAGAETRGASTITNQLAKNLFLWPGRSLLRKGLEAGFTVLIEALWSKDRILEVYLNVVELGDGIYGAGAAARLHFRRRAADLLPQQAALLAAALPNPRVRGDALNAPFMRQRAAIVLQRMGETPLGERRVCRD
ncbi:MAG: monofunctional biosynthetic peptidoglycan transglycosylase [Rhodospirillaceae bacterium]|nr:monofunctional biosynthetic peptidoglycan transglycosylase [Rhodospirillaceae bacterium]